MSALCRSSTLGCPSRTAEEASLAVWHDASRKAVFLHHPALACSAEAASTPGELQGADTCLQVLEGGHHAAIHW